MTKFEPTREGATVQQHVAHFGNSLHTSLRAVGMLRLFHVVDAGDRTRHFVVAYTFLVSGGCYRPQATKIRHTEKDCQSEAKVAHQSSTSASAAWGLFLGPGRTRTSVALSLLRGCGRRMEGERERLLFGTRAKRTGVKRQNVRRTHGFRHTQE